VVVALILVLRIITDYKRVRRANLTPLLCLIFVGSATAAAFHRSSVTAASMLFLPKIPTISVSWEFLISLIDFSWLLPHLIIWVFSLVVIRKSHHLTIDSTHRVVAFLTPPYLFVSLFFSKTGLQITLFLLHAFYFRSTAVGHCLILTHLRRLQHG